jgi:hypothetical protein
MERSREYLIQAIERRDPNVLRDIVDTLDSRFPVAVAKKPKAVAEVPYQRQEFIRNLISSVSWDGVTGKPDTFPPDLHTHSQYLTEELDPVFTASPAGGITQTDIDNWNAVPAITLPSSADAIGTDSDGVAVRRDVTISEDAPVSAPGPTDWIWFVVDPL